jgi:hypothetical protein
MFSMNRPINADRAKILGMLGGRKQPSFLCSDWPMFYVGSLEEIVLMVDSYMAKPGKRGPYKKRISN